MLSKALPEKTSEEIEKEASEYPILTFADIIRALKKHPHWLFEIRKIILTSELLELPAKFEELIKRVDKIEQKVEDLAKDVAVLKQDVAVLKQDVAVLKQDVAVLKQDVAVLKQDVEVLKQDVAVLKKDVEWLKQEVRGLKIDVAALKGDNFERKVRERAPAYFGSYFRKVRVISIEEWAEKLDEALDEGIITEEERQEALRLDLLISCQKRKTKEPCLLAVEASLTADTKDAERALRRADLFFRVYKIETIPIVIAKEFSSELEEEHPEVLFIRVEPE